MVLRGLYHLFMAWPIWMFLPAGLGRLRHWQGCRRDRTNWTGMMASNIFPDLLGAFRSLPCGFVHVAPGFFYGFKALLVISAIC
tara:strand:+ start:39404 stop:39655 length:252 start_codon:yes stop_codon:yes gene_type:complete